MNEYSFPFDFDLPPYLQILPGLFERLDSSRWFLNCACEYEGESLYAKRLIRASLSEFKSSFDCLNSDLRSIGKKEIWDRSAYSKQLEQDFVLRIIRNARDLSVHSNKSKARFRSSTLRVISPEGSHISTVSSIYFDKLEMEHDRTTLSRFTKCEIEKMQGIFEDFPCFMILSEGYKRISIILENFLADNKLVSLEESEAFWQPYI